MASRVKEIRDLKDKDRSSLGSVEAKVDDAVDWSKKMEKLKLLSDTDQEIIGQLKDKMDELKKELENKSVTVQAVQRNFQVMSSTYQEEHAQLESLKGRARQDQKLLKELEHDLAQTKAEMHARIMSEENLKAEWKKAHEALNESQQISTRLAKEVLEANAELGRTKEQLAARLKQCDTFALQCQRLDSSLQDARIANIDTLRRVQEKASTDMRELEGKLSASLQELAEVRAHINSQREDKNSDIIKLQRELVMERDKTLAEKQKLMQAHAEIRDLKSKQDTIIGGQHLKSRQVEDQISKLQFQLQKALSDNNAKDHDFEKQLDAAATLAHDCDQLRAHVSDLQKQLSERNTTADTDSKTLGRRFQELDAKYSSLEKSSYLEAQRFQGDIRQAHEEARQLQDKNRHLRVEILQLEGVRRKLETDLEEQRYSYDQQRKSMGSLQEEAARQSDVIRDLEHELTKHQRVIGELRDQLHDQANLVDRSNREMTRETQARLSELEQRFKSEQDENSLQLQAAKLKLAGAEAKLACMMSEKLDERIMATMRHELGTAVAKVMNVEEAEESTLSCMSCLNLLERPMSCVPCGHAFCDRCTPGVGGSCMECGESVRTTIQCEILDQLVGKMVYKRQALAALCDMSKRLGLQSSSMCA